jgi:hypothetical protein
LVISSHLHWRIPQSGIFAGLQRNLTSMVSFLNPIDNHDLSRYLRSYNSIPCIILHGPRKSPYLQLNIPTIMAHLTINNSPYSHLLDTDSGNPIWLNIDRTSHIWNSNLQIAAQPPDSPSADHPTLTTTKPSSIKLSLSHFSYHPTNTRHTNHPPLQAQQKRKTGRGED